MKHFEICSPWVLKSLVMFNSRAKTIGLAFPMSRMTSRNLKFIVMQPVRIGSDTGIQ